MRAPHIPSVVHSFDEKLEASKGARAATDAATIMALLDGCSSVEPAPEALDRIGVDYIATLRRGAEVYVDVKSRVVGCSIYWDSEPELAIETWSVVPVPPHKGKAGWTLDEAKITDMILYAFHPSDCATAYLLPFQSLRMASRRNLKDWQDRHRTWRQSSGRWKSEALFVPASEVLAALRDTFSGPLPAEPTRPATPTPKAPRVSLFGHSAGPRKP